MVMLMKIISGDDVDGLGNDDKNDNKDDDVKTGNIRKK